MQRSLRFSLRQERDFFVTARMTRTRHLRAFYRPLDEQGLRAAVVVKKTHGKAHERAKTRRRVQSALTALLVQTPLLFAPSYAVVLLAQGPPQTYETYLDEVQELLERIQKESLQSPAELA